MSRDLSVYTGRITPWQSTRPNFVATVSGTLLPVVTAGAVVESVPLAFDLDTAIGVQLDITGKWIGPTRNVPLPIPGTDFTWSDATRGWAQGLWKGPYSQKYGIIQLDDETYRRLLKSVVMSNHWDGTVPGMQAIFNSFFIDPATLVFIQDQGQVPYPSAVFSWASTNRGWTQAPWSDGTVIGTKTGNVDVAITIAIAGKIPPPVYLGLLAQNALRLKPAGVSVKFRITSVDQTPVFGFGITNQYIGGWGSAAWGATPEYLLNNT